MSSCWIASASCPRTRCRVQRGVSRTVSFSICVVSVSVRYSKVGDSMEDGTCVVTFQHKSGGTQPRAHCARHCGSVNSGSGAPVRACTLLSSWMLCWCRVRTTPRPPHQLILLALPPRLQPQANLQCILRLYSSIHCSAPVQFLVLGISRL